MGQRSLKIREEFVLERRGGQGREDETPAVVEEGGVDERAGTVAPGLALREPLEADRAEQALGEDLAPGTARPARN